MELQQEKTQTGASEGRQFIGGEWVDAAGGDTFESRDPFTGDVVADVAAGGREDAARAVDAAQAAFPEWSKTPPAMRQGIFLKAADILESRQDEIVSLLARETGCTFGFAMFQTHVFVPGLLRQAAALAYAPLGEVIPSDTGAFSMGLRRPVGVVGAIAPWNAALILSARSIAAPLALGNTVVLKPSELSPVVGGLIWGEIFTEAGLPPGVLNIVTHAPGEAGPIGDELVENPHVRTLNFTGSTETGRKLAEAAGRNLKRDPARARRLQPADRARRRRPGLRGQRDDVRRVPAPGPDLHVGAQDHRRAADRRRVHREARREDQGPQGGRPEGARHDHRPADQRERPPGRQGPGRRRGRQGGEGAGRRRGGGTLLPGNAPDRRAGGLRASRRSRRSGRSRRSRSSTAPRRRSTVANATTYGLASGIITQDADRGLALAQQIEAGIVHVNDQPVGDEPQMPFGGVKDSGFGRFGGSAVVDEFTELRWITVQSGSHPFPF